MSSSDNSNLYRAIIMDHYQNSRNKGLVENPRGYMTVRLKNPSCGDDLTVQLKVEGTMVKEVHQLGAGCSICCASASMMAESLEGQTLEEALRRIDNFNKMVQGEAYDEDLVGEAVSLEGVSHLPQRVKCATLAWQASKRGLEKIEDERARGLADHEANEGSIEDDVSPED